MLQVCKRFEGLNGARLLASIHIVLGHLYQLGALGGGSPRAQTQLIVVRRSGGAARARLWRGRLPND